MAAMQQMLMASASSSAPLAPVVVSYVGSTTVTATTTTQTQSGVPIGAAAANRYVFIIVHWQTNPSPFALLSATIGGVTAKVHANGSSQGNANYLGTAIISALVPTGTTATVSLTYASGASAHQSYLETYNVTGLVSDTPVATISTGVTSVSSYSGTIDVKKNGLLLFGGTMYSGATSYVIGGATQDYDLNIGGGGTQRSDGSSLVPTADQSARPVTINRSGGGGTTFYGSIAGASFR